MSAPSWDFFISFNSLPADCADGGWIGWIHVCSYILFMLFLRSPIVTSGPRLQIKNVPYGQLRHIYLVSFIHVDVPTIDNK